MGVIIFCKEQRRSPSYFCWEDAFFEGRRRIVIVLDATYSVLLVSSSQKFNTITKELLPGTEFFPITEAHSIAEANQKVRENTYDIVIINAPLPDNPGLKLAQNISHDSLASVLLLVKDEIYDATYYSAYSSGVIIVSKPISPRSMTRATRALCSVRERIRIVEGKHERIDKGIEDMDLLARAKLLLIECLQMTEPEAHRYISRQAMDKRVSIREAAEDIIKTYQ